MTSPQRPRAKLTLTADAATSSVHTTVIDDADHVLATGRTIENHLTRHQVIFDPPEQLAKLAGQSVRLRFELHHVKLYALSFEE